MEVLSKLFASADRVKAMRLFILNSEAAYTAREVVDRSKISPASGRRELNLLKEAGLIKTRTQHSSVVYFLNTSFAFLSPLKQLLFNTELFKKEEIIRRLRRVGRIKLIITAGIFISDEDSRADLLIVGDDLSKGATDRAIRSMEAEIGKELSYGVFESEDFKYRVSVCDKFIRDILDYPHKKILNKLEGAF